MTGRRLAGNIAGLLAAAATASSPIVLDQAFQPMSDVPAACAWLVAAVALARGTRTGDAAAAAAAIAVRLPIAVAALAFSWWQRWLYRGATETGYGAFGSFFSPTPVRPNLATYPKWLFESHGYTWLLGLVAPSLLAAGRRRPSLPRPQSPVYRSRERRAISAFVFLVRSGATVNGR